MVLFHVDDMNLQVLARILGLMKKHGDRFGGYPIRSVNVLITLRVMWLQ